MFEAKIRKKVELNLLFGGHFRSPTVKANRPIKLKYVDVILPLPLGSAFTYDVPEEWSRAVRVGMRVVVPFGKKKMYTGIITLIHTNKPELYEAKPIIFLLDEEPILRYPQMKFWEWISSYYQCSVGEVYQAAVPSGLKLESETQVRVNADYDGEIAVTDKEHTVLSALSDGKVQTVSELSRSTDLRGIVSTLKQLLEKDLIEVSEEITEKYKPKTQTYIRLTSEAANEERLKAIFDELSRAKKQLDLLMRYIELSRCLSKNNGREVSRKELLEVAGASPAVLSGLLEKRVLETYIKDVGRLNLAETKTENPSPLTEPQRKAYDEILRQFAQKHVTLLHGVTSAGKTEIYIHLMLQTLAEGRQTLYLVPEIALTTQLTSRLKRVFGNKLGIYHSKFSDAERVEIWNNMLHGKGYEIIIGVRSSVFLPFRQLGLVIVDEEHESSYKQFDPAPRYHARNAAIMLASMHGAKTLLGTATPAIETYYNAKTGKYGLVQLTDRYRSIELPEIVLIDTKEAYRKKQMEGHFSPELKKRIGRALSNSEQVILFQNRRGYAPYLECTSCAYVPKCKHCDVSLTVHKYLNKLTCHYCGYTESIPTLCPVCGTPNLVDRGFGTERIEQEVQAFFPSARVARMDFDTTRSKKSYDRLITDFESAKIDILIGTQMVTKGLDFERVSLVGILSADSLLNFPDFRAHERAYQLMAQVSGRAGRKHKRGAVVLQTSNPEHPIIGLVVRNDYAGMFSMQCDERMQYRYPPFYRLVEITLRHRDIGVVSRAANEMAVQLGKVFGNRVCGPNVPMVSRVQNRYIKNILLKVEQELSFDQAKKIVQEISHTLLALPDFKSLRLSLDVDPM